MDKKMTYIVIAVVAIVVVAAAAVALMGSQGGSNNGKYSSFNVVSTKNLVFGNANNDNYLNNDDVTFIQDIVDKKTTWDNLAYPLADTNADGIITADDVTLLKKFLNGEKATMYYMDYYKDISSVKYPVSGPISVDWDTAYDWAVILGVLDQVKGTRTAASNFANYNDTLYPGLKDRIVSIRDDSGNMDVEKMYAIGTKLVIGDPNNVTDKVVEGMLKVDPECNILKLPTNRSMNDIDYCHSIITLGTMMNRQDAIKDYVKFVEDVEGEIRNSIVNSGAATKTLILAYNPSNPNNLSIEALSTHLMQYTDVVNVLKLPFTMPVDRIDRVNGGWLTGLEIEWFIDKNPDVIYIDTYGLVNKNYTKEEYQAIIDTKVGYFTNTNAYKNNMVFTCAYEVLGGVPGIACLPLIGSYIWGNDVFNEEKAWSYLNYFYQHFTNMGADVDMSKLWGYAPEHYGATL